MASKGERYLIDSRITGETDPVDRSGGEHVMGVEVAIIAVPVGAVHGNVRHHAAIDEGGLDDATDERAALLDAIPAAVIERHVEAFIGHALTGTIGGGSDRCCARPIV